jgi:hypothetical protein
VSAAAVFAFPITTDIRQQRARQHDKVLADRTLKPGAKNAYTVLHRRCYVTGECDDPIESLAERAGMGASTFRDHTRILRRRGHIDWTRTGRENRWFLTGQTQQSVCLETQHSDRRDLSTRPAQDIGMPRAMLEDRYKNQEKQQQTTAAPQAPPPVPLPAPPVVIPLKVPIISANEPIPTAANSPVIDLIAQEAGAQIARLATVLSPDEAMQALAAAQEFRQNTQVRSFASVLRTAQRQRWKPNNPFYYNEIRQKCSLAPVFSPDKTTAARSPATDSPAAVEFPRCSVCDEPMAPEDCLVPQERRHARCTPVMPEIDKTAPAEQPCPRCQGSGYLPPGRRRLCGCAAGQAELDLRLRGDRYGAH